MNRADFIKSMLLAPFGAKIIAAASNAQPQPKAETLLLPSDATVLAPARARSDNISITEMRDYLRVKHDRGEDIFSSREWKGIVREHNRKMLHKA